MQGKQRVAAVIGGLVVIVGVGYWKISTHSLHEGEQNLRERRDAGRMTDDHRETFNAAEVVEKPIISSSQQPFSTEPQANTRAISQRVPSDSQPLDVSGAMPVMGTLVHAVIKQGEQQEATALSPTNDDYRFPLLVDMGNGEQAIIIGSEPIPSRSARRQLKAGDGALAKAGDQVRFRYDMFSWSTGELVETSGADVVEGLSITLGDTVEGNQVPLVLHNALYNRRVGSRIQVVFEQGLDDLPSYLNPNDGYVLVVDVEGVTPMSEGRELEVGEAE